ncbi:DUF975 family protein [Heyndrickxia sp. NPDC080065]|uniref:DUF975 family protein n=1 Tax=Heyndrickxia sp. NPDC080065 TaxID=3390568 RepID=UPI003D03EBD2
MISGIKRDSRFALKNRWGFAILISIISGVIYAGVPWLIEIVFSGSYDNWVNNEPGWVTTLGWIITLLLIPITIGSDWVFLHIARKENAKIRDLFIPFSNGKLFVRSIGLPVLMWIYTFLWTLLLIIPGIIKTLAYSQSYYIYKDHPEYSLNEIITESRRIMDGHKWDLFLLQLSFIGWAILSIISLGIGFIWLVPYFNASMATFYDQLSK